MLRRTVLEPLGIKNVTLAHQPADLRAVMTGGSDGYHPGWVYHCLLVGPLHDAARLLERLLGGALLPAELVQEMRSARSIGPAIPGRHGGNIAIAAFPRATAKAASIALHSACIKRGEPSQPGPQCER